MRLTPTTLVKLIGMVQAGRIDPKHRIQGVPGHFRGVTLDPGGVGDGPRPGADPGRKGHCRRGGPGPGRSIPSLRRIIGPGKEKALGFLMGRVMKASRRARRTRGAA